MSGSKKTIHSYNIIPARAEDLVSNELRFLATHNIVPKLSKVADSRHSKLSKVADY